MVIIENNYAGIPGLKNLIRRYVAILTMLIFGNPFLSSEF
jgi:hypothetical protein